MNPNADQIKKELMGDVQGALAGLHSLRDEVRLQIHLGGMDARRKLDALEIDFEASHGRLDRGAPGRVSRPQGVAESAVRQEVI